MSDSAAVGWLRLGVGAKLGELKGNRCRDDAIEHQIAEFAIGAASSDKGAARYWRDRVRECVSIGRVLSGGAE